ncbi:MAG: SulP family inorganic anion transporter [Chloroflexota bacterium]
MNSLIERLVREFRPQRALPSLAVGLVAGINAVTVSIAFAALIFTGRLSSFLPAGIGMMLFGSIVLGVVAALLSAFPGVVCGIQDSAAILMALTAASIARGIAAGNANSLFPTLFAAVCLASALTGAVFFLLGYFRLGRLVRFVPYPVIGGFLAGSGLLLVQGAISVTVNAPFSWVDLPALLQPDWLVRCLAGLALGIALTLLLRRYEHFLILPGTLAIAVLAFYLILWFARIPVAQAAAQDWLLGSGSQAHIEPWAPLRLLKLAETNWPVVVGQLGNLAALVVISVISVLLNTTGVELAYGQDVDLNRELKVMGISNVVAALGGSIVGYHVLSDSTLAFRTGARSRLVGIFLAAVCVVALLAGGGLLSYLPTPVLGGLLFFMGADFLVTWLYEGWFKFSRSEYLIVVLITIAINIIGFLAGVGLGLGLAVILFVVEYSRVNVVRHELSGSNFSSNVERARLNRGLLRKKGDWIYILELQGFIFFGTAHGLLEQVRRHIHTSDPFRPRFVVLDFCRVTGMDASAILGFAKLRQFALTQELVLVFTGLPPKMQQQLMRNVCTEQDQNCWRIEPDLDHGVEWCEEQVIQTFAEVGLAERARTVRQGLESSRPTSPQALELIDRLLQDDAGQPAMQTQMALLRAVECYMERLSFESGYVLIQQGKPSQGLYFIEQGQVVVRCEGEGSLVRIRKTGPGTIVGELGLYLGTPASATVVTSQSSIVYRLTAENMERMESEDPQLAIAFHRFIAQVLGERVLHTTETLQAMSN